MTSGVASSITKHTIALCVDKRERGIGMQTLLTRAGYRVLVTDGMHDALKVVAQEMPHLIITECVLTDGTAANLFDRLKQHETLSKTPILAYALRKSKEELQQLVGRAFAGVLVGALDARAFIAKVQQTIASLAPVSPHFIDAKSGGYKDEASLAVNATAIGRNDEYVILRASAEVDPQANIAAVPVDGQLSPVTLRAGGNLREGNETFNLFPIHRLRGPGLTWISTLQEIKLSGAAEAQRQRRRCVLFLDTRKEYGEGWRQLLTGYGFEMALVSSWSDAVAAVTRDPGAFGAVWLPELPVTAESAEWRSVYAKIPKVMQPPLVVSTALTDVRSQSGMLILPRPFGVGQIVDILAAACLRVSDLGAAASATDGAGIALRYVAPARLVGIDETGGIVETSLPLVRGSRVTLQHALLNAAWGNQSSVQISGVAPSPICADLWHLRFEAVGAGMSKVKYWEKMLQQLKTVA